jgi:hypothetical protein
VDLGVELVRVSPLRAVALSEPEADPRSPAGLPATALTCIGPDAAPFGPTFGCSLIRSLPLISPCGLPGAVYRAASRAAWFYRLPSPSVRVRSKLD